MSDLARRHAEVVRRHGPWLWTNVHLGDDVWTMGVPSAPAADLRVQRVLQLVADHVGMPLGEARVLDLGAGEGAFSIELALHGAEVVAVEGRQGSAARVRFAAEALGLDRLRVEHADVRELGELGSFDVVLCLGLLYHLEAADVLELIERVAAATTRLAIVETQVALRARRTEELGGRVYRGSSYPEEAVESGASLEDGTSFWPTRASLLNLLCDSGFTSIAEVAMPVVPPVDAFRDHTTLIAARGIPKQLLSVSASGAAPRYPERFAPMAHPAQGLRWRIVERVARRWGGGVKSLFRPTD